MKAQQHTATAARRVKLHMNALTITIFFNDSSSRHGVMMIYTAFKKYILR